MKAILLCLVAVGCVAGLVSCSHSPAETLPDPADQARDASKHKTGSAKMEIATFAAGCFWGVEETFRQTKGVAATAVGYSGGILENPTYEDVCTDRTGHAEAVQVEYDPAQVSYEKLLDIFWNNHDPTTPNRQGPDVGTQYRSVIFYHDPDQQAAAVASKEKLEKSGKYRRPIVTAIVPATTFWRAEEYHQRYLEKRGMTSCRTH
jgi:peptide-methionine (S)-S-oxide reductase